MDRYLQNWFLLNTVKIRNIFKKITNRAEYFFQKRGKNSRWFECSNRVFGGWCWERVKGVRVKGNQCQFVRISGRGKLNGLLVESLNGYL